MRRINTITPDQQTKMSPRIHRAAMGASTIAMNRLDAAPASIVLTLEADGASVLAFYTCPTGWDAAMVVEREYDNSPAYRVTLADRNDTNAPPIAEISTTTPSPAGTALALWAAIAHSPERMIHALDDDQALAAWATNPHDVLRTLSNRATNPAHGLAEFIATTRTPARV
jgi:hypothetical protein